MEKPKEMLQQCTGIPEPGASSLRQKNTKEQKEASAEAEEAEQKDRMEASERERHHAEMLQQRGKEKAEREQEHQKVLLEMRQKVATLQAQQEEECTRFENAKQEVLLEEQKERKALSEALLQSRGELSRGCQQVQQLRQEVKEHQEKGQTIKAELQAELQEAQSEIQAAQRRHQEELQGIKEEMNLLLEHREALQKQVGELTSQLAASRELQEAIVQRAQDQSKQRLLEVEHVQKKLEEAENKNKALQVYLQNLEREWSHWEEVAQQNSELQASVNVLEREKARLLLSLEEKNLCIRTLVEKKLALKKQVSKFHSALQEENEQLRCEHRRELQELKTQIRALQDTVLETEAAQATREKQLLQEPDWKASVHELETAVSELSVRLQKSDDKALALARQCNTTQLELRMAKAQMEKLRAHNQELQMKLEECERDWWNEELKHASREIALHKEVEEWKEEAETLRQVVASLQRKLKRLKERKDVLQIRALEKKNVMHAAEMRNHNENSQQLEVEREGMQEELEHGAAASKKLIENAQILRTALIKSEMAKGTLKKHFDILKGKSCIQPAFKSEVEQLFCMSDTSLESEQQVASTEDSESPEWIIVPRRSYEVAPEGRSVQRTFSCVHISDAIRLDVPQVAQHSLSTSSEQAAGAEGKQLSEDSRKDMECVQDVAATSAEENPEKCEATTNPRRSYEVAPEGRRIRTLRRVFPPDYFTLPVCESAQENMSASGGEESSSSSE